MEFKVGLWYIGYYGFDLKSNSIYRVNEISSDGIILCTTMYSTMWGHIKMQNVFQTNSIFAQNSHKLPMKLLDILYA